MNEHAVRKILEGGGGPAGSLLRTILYLPGKAYGAAMRVRREAYRRNLFASQRVQVPVIAVGNLTAGGSGKTPMTLLVARMLQQMGKRPAILLRGYRQSDDAQSDEAALYQTLAPDIILRVNPDRRLGARQAIAAGANVLIMDDGFQHLKLRRDLDIVLIDATAPWGGGNTIPGGLLREPKTALSQAGAIVVTRSNQVAPDSLRRLLAEIRPLASPGVPILTAMHKPVRLRTFDETQLPLESLRGREVVALCGIARPEAFAATLRELGAEVVSVYAGGDHHNFNRKFVLDALAEASRLGAVAATTEKDAAKAIFAELPREQADNNSSDNNNVNRGIWIVGVEQAIEDDAALLEKIRAVFM